MEQRCNIILQNYLKTTEYNNDYKIINSMFLNYCFRIYYKTNILFLVYNNYYYIKFNNCQIKKNYTYNEYFYYYNNKNNRISFSKIKINLFKLNYIYNNKEWKFYNNFFNIYKKIIKIHVLDTFFMYYYSIKPPYIIYRYKKYNSIYIYGIKDLYSNHYSIIQLCI